MRNERRDITSNLTEIERIIRECYEKQYANKLDNLDEMENSQKNTNYQNEINEAEIGKLPEKNSE